MKMKRERLIAARNRRGWSQEDVAEALGIARNTVSAWERGVTRPYPMFVLRLCEMFNMTAEDLDLVEPQEQALQIAQGIGANDTMTRRGAMATLLGVPMSLALDGLASVEDALTQCAQGLPALWELYFEGKVEHVACLLPIYRFLLTTIANQPGAFQRQTLSLASQAWQLSCEVAIDQEDYGSAQDTGMKALLYAQAAEDVDMQVAALMRQANNFFHRKMTTYALQAYKQAIPLVAQASPLLRGRIYAGLAEVEGMRGEKQEALRNIGLAHEHYPERVEDDQAYRYTRISRYSLHVFGEGQTRLYLNQPEEALKQFDYVEQNLNDIHIEPLSHVDLLYYQSAALIMLNDLEGAMAKIQEAAAMAKSVGSRLYFGKIAQVYHQDMVQRWPHEDRVVGLADQFQPW